MDLVKSQVFRAGQQVHLTPTEYKLLAVLVRHAGKLMTHRQLLQEVWDPSFIEQTNYLRNIISQLRRKIESDPERPRFLLTEPGLGYRFKAE